MIQLVTRTWSSQLQLPCDVSLTDTLAVEAHASSLHQIPTLTQLPPFHCASCVRLTYELQATYSAVRDTAVKHPTTTWPGTLVPINNLIGFWSRFNEICLSTLVTRELSRRDHLIGFTNRFNEIRLGYAGRP